MIKALNFTLLAFFSSLTLYAQEVDSISLNYQWEKAIENKITPMVQQIDPKALIMVETKARENGVTKNRPTHPFDFQGIAPEKENKIKISLIQITLYSEFPERFSPEWKKKIKSSINHYGARVELKTEKHLPPSISPDPLNVEAQDKDRLQKFWSGPGLIVGMVVSGLILGLLGVFSSKGIQKSLTESAQRFLQARENLEEKARPEQRSAKLEEKEAERGSSKGKKDALAGDELQQLKGQGLQIPFESMVALISDCYWCQEDEVAKFYWSLIDCEVQKKLLSELNFLEDYVKSFEMKDPLESVAHRDISYLSPQKLELVSNLDLADFIQDHPLILIKLSEMRLNHLPLKALEKLALWQRAERLKKQGGEITLPKLQSPHRDLERLPLLEIRSEEEELSLLKENITDLEIIKSIPSLIWSLNLPVDTLKELFRPMGARQLAELWVAPEVVLAHLQKAIPEKKWDLMREYLAQGQADRRSEGYKEVSRKIIDLISKQEENVRNVTTKQVA